MDCTKNDTVINKCSLPKTAIEADENQAILRFGLITDVHQDVMHDAVQRIKAFAEAMNEANADFICHLGDFCQAHESNREFLETWNCFKGNKHHVLGNHDMDSGFTREQAVAFFGMPNKQYSFDNKGVHVMVLDGNEPGGTSKGYKRYISKNQLDWISEDLKATSLPTIVFSHQTLDGVTGVENSEDVRKIFEETKTKAGQKKVLACFCGHHHDDQATEINGIHYIRINSASYTWLGLDYVHESYSKEIHKKFEWISCTSPYKEPLWALIEINLAKGTLTIKGKESSWVGPTPWELGVPEQNPVVWAPRITDRTLSF